MSADDAARPLTEQGERDARRMGAWMAREGLVPDHVVTSPAARALQTARLALPGREPTLDERVYEASPHDLLAVLADAPPGAERVLLVGHNPGMESLVRALDPTVQPPADGALVEPCTLARLEVDDLRPGGGRLLDLRHADRLPSA